MYGVIPGGIKQHLHTVGHTPQRFAKLLIGTYQVVTPTLTIVDGIIGLEGE